MDLISFFFFFPVCLITEAAQSNPQQNESQGKEKEVSEIDWIEIKSITQMLSYCKYFNKRQMKLEWNCFFFFFLFFF